MAKSGEEASIRASNASLELLSDVSVDYLAQVAVFLKSYLELGFNPMNCSSLLTKVLKEKFYPLLTAFMEP